MTELNGFVMLHRSIREWEWYTDMNTKAVFIELMLTANFKAKQYRGYDIPRGAVVTSVASLANTLGLTARNIRTALGHLQTTGEVTISATPKFSIIKLNNWDKYQSGDKQNDSQPTSDRQSAGKPSANDRQTTVNQPTNDRQHLNNDNKDNKENNEYNDNKGGEAGSAAGAPTPMQVKEYFLEMRYESDPEMFYNYYSATGWKRKGTPITDWRSLADVWEKRGDRTSGYYDRQSYDRNTYDRQSGERQPYSDYSGSAPKSWDNLRTSIFGDLSELSMFND